MIKIKPRNEKRKRRHQRVRVKVSGSADCPRLNVFRSGKHIYGQLIDDRSGRTLVAASSLDPMLREQSIRGGDCEAAGRVGVLLAQRALDSGIKKVVFDRGGYLYHGRVKALADAARKEGLNF